MTSPLTLRISDTEASEIPALSPSMKIFVAAAIIVGGAAVAAAFWKASINFEHLISNENPAIDERIVKAPMPVPEMVLKKEATVGTSFPPLTQKPAVDSGQGKYNQMYTPPILPPIPDTLKTSKAPDKPVSSDQNLQMVTAKTTVLNKATFEPLYKIQDKIQAVSSSEKNVNFECIKKKPPTAPGRANDKMLSLFQFADNFEPSRKAEPGLPENPFLTAPASNETKSRSDINNNLVPLRVESQNQLAPLNLADLKTIELEPLKVISKP